MPRDNLLPRPNIPDHPFLRCPSTGEPVLAARNLAVRDHAGQAPGSGHGAAAHDWTSRVRSAGNQNPLAGVKHLVLMARPSLQSTAVPSGPPSEGGLVSAARDGDTTAFAELVAPHL